MKSYYRKSFLIVLTLIKQLEVNPYTSPLLCLEAQESLIRILTRIEKRIQRCKNEIATLKRQLRIKKISHDAKAISQKIKSDIEFFEIRAEEYRELLNIFRTLGDAIAFLYISKWDIKPMSFKEAPGFLSGKKGSRNERRIMRAAFNQGNIAILNDLTNCLQYGDITIVNPHTHMLLEVKSSDNTNARTKRQSERLSKLQNYLATDKVEGLYRDNEEMIRLNLLNGEINLRRDLNDVIELAYANGVASKLVEAGVI